jgi:hypothetical protein
MTDWEQTTCRVPRAEAAIRGKPVVCGRGGGAAYSYWPPLRGFGAGG